MFYYSHIFRDRYFNVVWQMDFGVWKKDEECHRIRIRDDMIEELMEHDTVLKAYRIPRYFEIKEFVKTGELPPELERWMEGNAEAAAVWNLLFNEDPME